MTNHDPHRHRPDWAVLLSLGFVLAFMVWFVITVIVRAQ